MSDKQERNLNGFNVPKKREDGELHVLDGYRPEYDDLLIKHMARGKSFWSFGKVAKTGLTTLKSWAKRHPSFAAAKQQGEAEALDFFEELQSLGSTGGTREYKDSDGKKHVIKPDSRFTNFALARRFNTIYSEKQVVEHQGEMKSRLHIDYGKDEEKKPDGPIH